ncbi:hypothetical protein EYF80_011788 [Liparis tanakae]|uniref:Uncharacterized protein n=1 Tax=Liparis tanakae TaxID=230148 RepID=A0A4Z2IKL7_9TELE|nr:hypothetical protein EYF80_011788 [Liparis tanakae]
MRGGGEAGSEQGGVDGCCFDRSVGIWCGFAKLSERPGNAGHPNCKPNGLLRKPPKARPAIRVTEREN